MNYNNYLNNYAYYDPAQAYTGAFYHPSLQQWDPSFAYAQPYSVVAQPAQPPMTTPQYYTEKFVDGNNVFKPPSSRPEQTLQHIPLPEEPYLSTPSTSSQAAPVVKGEKKVVAQFKKHADKLLVSQKNNAFVGEESSSSSDKKKTATTKNPSKAVQQEQPIAYRFKPYNVRNPPPTEEEYPKPPFRLAPNRDILVVDPISVPKPASNVINLRKPSAVIRDYTAVPPTLSPAKYVSTVSNRLGKRTF